MLKVFPLFSGSTGNCTYVKYGDDQLLIDAGVSFKNICASLSKIGTDISQIKAVLVTHEHSDHVKGLDTLCKKCDIPIYINRASYDTLSVPFAEKCIVKNDGESINVGKIKASVFSTPHDSSGSVGYRFSFEHGESLGFATDIGCITQNVKDGLLGCTRVVIESNHDVQMLKNGPYPYILKKRILSDNGHLSNDACASFLPELIDSGTKKITLAHLSLENNSPETAYYTSAKLLTDAGFTPQDVRLKVAMKSIL